MSSHTSLKNALALVVFIFCFHSSLSAQIVGGTATGQMTPKEASAGSIVSGGVSGDVNMFTGTFNASYDLGSVSTLSGMSFSLSMSYNSTFASGDNVPTLSGVPYGEGWSLNIPTISVSSEDYNKYSAQRRKHMADNRRPVYFSEEAQREGDLYWFEPMLNIPGVGGGRMVLKRTIEGGNKHVFVLHKFERYIEAIFDGRRWEIIMDDGTRYEFAPMIKAHREASNQRVHPSDANCSDDHNAGYAATSSLVMPKTEYLSWYCTSIRHPDLIGMVSFTYNLYGKDIDFFKRYKQEIHRDARDFIDDVDINPHELPLVYRDVHLASIQSGYERLILDYSVINMAGSSNMLDPNDPSVTNLDDLYAKKMVYSSNENDFTDWYRYRHIKAVDVNYQISSQNPYVRVGALTDYCGIPGNSPQGEYYVEQAANGQINHSFLESPRLNPFHSSFTTQGGNAIDNLEMPPGEIYEVKATVSGNASSAALFDVNIASGDFSIPHTMPGGTATWLPACEYADTRGHAIHSTFDKALKWHVSDGTDAQISEFFVLPNNPQAYAGFNIQIGLANSDNDYNMAPASILAADNEPSPSRSYFNHLTGYGDDYLSTELYGSPGQHNGHDSGISVVEPQLGLFPTDRIGSNFGIGLPWHNMLDLYEISDRLRLSMCPEDEARSFWWNIDPSPYNYPSNPTQAGTDYSLSGVEVWRYSKKPLMLTGVTKQNFIGTDGTVFNPDNSDAGWVTVANQALEYSIDAVAITNTVIVNGAAINESTGYFRNIVRLDRILVTPAGTTDGGGGALSYPTTHFEYENVSGLIKLGDFFNTYYLNNQIEDETSPYYVDGDINQDNYFKVLKQIVNPLGQVTELEYQSVDNTSGNSYAIPRYLGTRGLAYEPPIFYNKLNNERTYKAPGFALQTYMVAKEKKVQQKGDGFAFWSYEFSGINQYNNSVPLISNLRLSDPDRNRDFGYANVSVYGPGDAPGQGPKTEYTHSTNWLLWGKLLQTRSFDIAGAPLSESNITYESSVAFEPVQLRLAPQYQDEPANNIDHYYSYSAFTDRPPLPDAIYQQGASDAYNQYYDDILAYFEDFAGSGDCSYPYDQLSTFCYNFMFNRPVDDPFSALLTDCTQNLISYNPASAEYSDCLQAQICLDEYGSLIPTCSNGVFYDYSALPPDIRSNDGGEFETPYYYLGRPEFFDYASEVRPSAMYSYFIRKTQEVSTSFDHSCGGADGGFTNQTDYEYYDADHSGVFSSEGFAKMGITGDANKHLNWEPSWQLYKVRQTSPSVPNWEHTEEYFYVYDLINHEDYQDDDTHKPLAGMLRQIFDIKKRRDLVFEKRVTRKGSGGGENRHSTFYVYDDDWTPNTTDYVIETLSEVYGDDSCDGDTDGGISPYSLCTTNPQPGSDLCAVPGSALYCPCEIVAGGSSSSGFNSGSSGDGSSAIDTVDPDDVEAYLANFISGNIYLKETYIQTSSTATGSALISFPNPADFSEVEFGCTTLKTHTIHSRNNLGQVVKEEDEKGLLTEIDYGHDTVLEYDYCHDGRIYRQSQTISSYPGLPKSITVGAELSADQFPLTTYYGYHHSRQVAGITDPNDINLTFVYDDYNRLIEKRRNGDLIQEIQYRNWPNNHGYSFTERALENFVAVTDYTESGEGTVNTQFIDPLGRNVYTTSDGGGSSPLVTDNYFDIYGRVILAGPPTGSLPGSGEEDTGLQGTCIGMDYYLDTAPRNRPIGAAKNDLCLDDDPNVKYEYCIISADDIIATHTANGGNPDDFGDVLPSGISVLKTKITDEDGKTVTEYTNGIGQKIATLGGGIGGVAYAYDEFGNISKTVNAEQQTSFYTYNYLGLLREKITVDEGVTSYAYNPSGQMITLKSSEHAQVWAYDAFGRMTAQKKALGAIDNSSGGLPWVIDSDMTAYQNLLATGIPEKQWYYNQAADDAELNEGFGAYLSAMTGLKGKVAQTISFAGDDPIESRLLTYNPDGFLGWEVVRYLGFNSNLSYQLSYPTYNLQGSYIEQQVDLNCDGGLDFNYLYEYDGRNRIKEVGIDYPSLQVFNAKIASYQYHASYLSVTDKALHDYEFGVACTAEGVETVTYEYDTRQRMKSLGSDLFTELLYYDGENYNGNIDAVDFNYNMDRFTDVPLIFSGNTAYSYQYDGMNRLKKAEATVGFDLIDAHLYSGDFADLGDVNYEYDRVGNILAMTRGIIDHELKQIGFEKLAYELEEGNNKLTTLRYTGLNGIEQEFNYAYNSIGCMTSDDRRGIAGIDYIRGVYPTGVAGNDYLYDVNDMRVARSGQDKEYYLRDAAGKELAIFNSEQGLSWYIHGNERVAKIAADKCGDSLCRPQKPECSTQTAQTQATQLAELPYVNDPFSLVYPNLLVRVQFCDGKDRYLLFEELKLVDGPYNILQQIVLTEPNAILGVALNDNPVEAMLLKQFFMVRENAETLNVNNYQACAIFCPAEVYTCSDAIATTQLNYLTDLHDILSANTSGLSFPDKLHRLRMCNGVEVYLLEQQLADFPGFGMILQTLEVNDLAEEFSVSVNGAEAITITGSQLVSTYLAETAAEIRLEGYVPCYQDLPCDPSLPDCSLADALNGGPDLNALYDAIANANQLPSGTVFPVELFRLRFCDGQEYYVLDSEMPLIAESNYTLLQHLFIPNTATSLAAKTTMAAQTNLTIDQILAARANDQLLSLLDYESCGQVAECEGPICSPAETEQQTVVLDQLETDFAAFDPATLTYPNTVYRLRFCEGREMYFLAQELPLAPSSRVVQQQIEVSTATDVMELVNQQGLLVPGTLADFVNLRAAGQLYTIGDFVPCRYRLQTCRTPQPVLSSQSGPCDAGDAAAQLAVLEVIKNTFVSPNSLAYPQTLRRVALCDGQEVYLFEEEIAQMPHTLAVLQEIPLSAASDQFDLWLYGGSVVENATMFTLLTERFNDIHPDFRVVGYGCEVEEVGQDTDCDYEAFLTDFAINPHATDPYSINYTASLQIERDCDDGSSDSYDLSDLINAQKNCVFMEYRFSLPDLAVDNPFHITELGFATLNPSGQLAVDVHPDTYLQTYPYFSTYSDPGCPIPQITPDDLRLYPDENSQSDCDSYVTSVERIIEYAYDSWGQQMGVQLMGDDDSPAFAEFDATSNTLSIFVPVFDYPDSGYFNIDNLNPVAAGQYAKSEKDEYVYASVHKRLIACSPAIFEFVICDTITQVDLSSYLPDELPLTTTDEWYSVTEFILCCTAGGTDCCANGPQSLGTFSCTDTGLEITCDPVISYCVDGSCEGCPRPTDLSCEPEDIADTQTALQQVDAALTASTPASYTYPTVLYQLEFCGEQRRYIFREELGLVSELNYTVRQRIHVESATEQFRLTLIDASAAIGGITDLLVARKEGTLARVDPIPDFNPPPGDDTPDTGNETELFTTGYEQDLQISYYLYDHLGNTRIVFHTELDCAGEIDYVAEYVADYYPFGKILREWVACDVERYLTTYHERDKESGYDYRGARLYDSDLGRFLSTDPMATNYPAWSPYTYVANNPIIFVDPTGKQIDITYETITDENGKVVSVNVRVSIVGKVLNASGTDVDVASVAKFINAELSRLFNTKVNNAGSGIPWNVSIDAQYSVASSMDDVSETDHLLVMVDDVNYTTGTGRSAVGLARTNGLIAYTEIATVGGGCSKKTPDYEQIGTVSVHEILHNFGLDDMYDKPKGEQVPGHYMMGYSPGEKNLRGSDVREAVSSPANLNQGSNSSNQTDVGSKEGFWGTSNDNPFSKKTVGKDGRIPKIIN